MTSSPDLASLYQLLAKEQRPILPSGERRAILGCGYVGEAVAKAWRQEGHELWGTTTRHERLTNLAEIVDTPVIFDSTFLGGLQILAEALQQRPRQTPLQLVHLSSCGVYGNQQGALTDETVRPDSRHPVNGVLAMAEDLVQSLRSESVNVCILRLGGIYGPGRDIPAMLLSAAGGVVQRNGQNVPCWIHRDDIVSGVSFAFDHQLNDTYNLVNDTQCTGQELTDRLCEQAGLPLAKWLTIDTTDRVLNARVSNAKLKQLGFTLSQPSMVG